MEAAPGAAETEPELNAGDPDLSSGGAASEAPESPDAAVAQGPDGAETPAPVTAPPGMEWQPGVPDLREHLPSIIWGAALPIAVYFLARRHVGSDAQALIVAGGCSVVWIVIQFVRQRRVDLVGVIVLFGFAIGVATSVVFHGNDYMLKVRDAFFTALFGAACVITVFTHERPTLFYVSRYLSAGNDPDKVSAYNQLLEHPTGRRTFQVLSVVWGIGLMAEAGFRMFLATVLPTSHFLAVSPVITVSIIGSLFAFTVVYSKRAQLEATASMLQAMPDVPPTPDLTPNDTLDPLVGKPLVGHPLDGDPLDGHPLVGHPHDGDPLDGGELPVAGTQPQIPLP